MTIFQASTDAPQAVTEALCERVESAGLASDKTFAIETVEGIVVRAEVFDESVPREQWTSPTERPRKWVTLSDPLTGEFYD